jgi:hypothetical protein
MKTKTRKVISNSGRQADLQSGLEKKEVQRPTHISASEFVHWLGPESRIDDDRGRYLSCNGYLPRERNQPTIRNSH